MKILFSTETITFEGVLNTSSAAHDILHYLPFSSKVSLWGDEIFFDCDFKLPSKEKTMNVVSGDIAYWPQGPCLCIFFGPTPASTSDEPMPASDVVLLGHTSIDPDQLRKIQYGEKITVSVQKS